MGSSIFSICRRVAVGPGAAGKMPLVVFIEGGIGAGKSTLLEHIAAAHEAGGRPLGLGPEVGLHVIREDVAAWRAARTKDGRPLFDAYYEDPGTHAFDFQAYVAGHRARQNEAARGSGAGVILCERSLDTCREVFVAMAARAGHLGPAQVETYDTFWETARRHLRPDVVVLCDPGEEVAGAWYEARGRSGERASPEWRRECAALSAAWAARMAQEGCQVVEVDTSAYGPAGPADWAFLAPRPAPRLALCGQAGQGKTTLAGLLRAEYGCREVIFAAMLRELAERFTGIPAAVFEGRETKDKARPALGGGTPREYLCALGRALRPLAPLAPGTGGPLIHGAAAMIPATGPVVISDCRTEAEVAAARRWGFKVVKIRGRLPDVDTGDITETAVLDLEADVVLENAGTEAELIGALRPHL